MTYGYMRYGCRPEQIPDWEKESLERDLRRAGADVVVTDYRMSFQPSQLEHLLNSMQRGDRLIVRSLSRISRDTRKCLVILEDLRNRGIEVRMLKEGMSSFDPHFQMIAKALMEEMPDPSGGLHNRVRANRQI